jgi:GntR family transcriptional regulator
MELDLDPTDPTPLYLQIAGRLRRLVALGALRAGDRLPTVRDLAVRGRVNRNTAARAIQELERDGVVRTRVGQGTFVADGAVDVGERARDAVVDKHLDRVVEEAARLHAPLDRLPDRLRERVERFEAERPRRQDV